MLFSIFNLLKETTYDSPVCLPLQYRTEKDGVVETHVEKRTRQQMMDYEDIDYDEVSKLTYIGLCL